MFRMWCVEERARNVRYTRRFRTFTSFFFRSLAVQKSIAFAFEPTKKKVEEKISKNVYECRVFMGENRIVSQAIINNVKWNAICSAAIRCDSQRYSFSCIHAIDLVLFYSILFAFFCYVSFWNCIFRKWILSLQQCYRAHSLSLVDRHHCCHGCRWVLSHFRV